MLAGQILINSTIAHLDFPIYCSDMFLIIAIDLRDWIYSRAACPYMFPQLTKQHEISMNWMLGMPGFGLTFAKDIMGLLLITKSSCLKYIETCNYQPFNCMSLSSLIILKTNWHNYRQAYNFSTTLQQK